MGTASTMACIAEALGMTLPGTAAIPAVHADRLRAAEATGDHQWIHVDVARATKEIGGPIAHGFLTLSLLIPLWTELLDVPDAPVMVDGDRDRPDDERDRGRHLRGWPALDDPRAPPATRS